MSRFNHAGIRERAMPERGTTYCKYCYRPQPTYLHFERGHGRRQIRRVCAVCNHGIATLRRTP